ncbi:hypothetical protein UPYG_G00323770 [Umbra pygmaea]|uniref:Heme-binding protein 2 n=1 Tax=Umbra pygmaea TaxID=75934 RepID=A0ABD0W592_UMBPY
MKYPLCVLAVAFLCAAQGWDEPEFCHGYECPEFDVINTNEEFEARAYKASTWITIDSASDSDSDLKVGFTKLWDYTQGDNEESQTINTHTWPALISLTEVDGKKNFSLYFFVASENKVLPTPKAPIRVETIPACIIYVRVFSSYPTRGSLQDNVEKHREALKLASLTFNPERHILAGYESPWTLIGRHNEIWIFAA